MDEDKKVDCTYPEGFNVAAKSLDFLPEEARVELLMTIVFSVQMI